MEGDPGGLRNEVLIEIGSTALQGLLYPFGIKPRPIASQGPGHTRPVVLIHGYGGNRSHLLPMEAYLRAIGFDRVFPFNFGSSEGIETLAGQLRDFVTEVRNACGCGRGSVDLVAYSLGGLVARLYLQELDGAKQVDQCITLSTPHYGTYSSFWTPTALGRQMRPDSEFIRRLNAPGSRAPGVRFFSLWAGRDLMVLPRENSIYREGDEFRLDPVGHMGILVHPRALKLVAERLRSGQAIPQTKIQAITKLGKELFQKGAEIVAAVRKT